MYRLLIVDDEVLIRKGLSQIIKWKEIGYDLVGTAENAARAIEIAKDRKIDVLLTDVSMPEMSGLELIKYLKEINPKLKTVVISGYSEFDYAMEAIKLKVEHYILKPLEPKKITSVFENIKKDLDQENEDEKNEKYLQANLDIMKSLYSDFKNFSSLGIKKEKVKYRLILLQILTIKDIKMNEELKAFTDDLNKNLRGYIYKNFEGLFVILTMSSQTSKIIEEIKSLLTNNKYQDNLNFKVVVSSEFLEMYNVTSIYLECYDQLKHVKSGEVVDNPSLFNSRENKYIIKFFNRFTSIIEKGQDVEAHTLVNEFVDEIRKDPNLNPYMIAGDMLRNIIFYFRIDMPYIVFFRKDEEADLNRDEDYWERYKVRVEEELNNVVMNIKINSESMSEILSHKARRLIDENYFDKDLSLKEIAVKLNISYGYLSTAFTKTFGISFSKYLANLRLEKARGLLMERKYKIYEISDKVGYSSSRYFTDAFKKKYGLSPADYVKRINMGDITDTNEENSYHEEKNIFKE